MAGPHFGILIKNQIKYYLLWHFLVPIKKLTNFICAEKVKTAASLFSLLLCDIPHSNYAWLTKLLFRNVEEVSSVNITLDGTMYPG
jgi:hypothetical protein